MAGGAGGEAAGLGFEGKEMDAKEIIVEGVAQYSEYRDWTIRGQMWLGCTMAHYENRILLLNGSNGHQGKDSFFED